MVTSPKYKVHKGIQKEIRFLFLERGIAMQYLGACAGAIFIITFLLGITFISLLLCVGLFVPVYLYFKAKDMRNRKHNIVKKNINKRKPDVIRCTSMIVIKNDRSFFNKR